MTDAQHGDDRTLFPGKAGERLRAAREAQGLSLAEVSARTRVPQRHLEAVESSAFGSLPSPTYAVGFARAYARSVGADEVAVARDVRAEVERLGPRTPSYEPTAVADPARVPSRGLAILAAGVALAIIILAALWFGSSWLHGDRGEPQVAQAVPAPAAGPARTAAPAAPTGGQVTLTATDTVWLRVYDAANKTLFLGTMKPGDHFDVPSNADHPEINVGRPDKLKVTLNGSAVPPLGDGSRPIKDVRVDAAAVAARLSGAPAPAPAASPTPVADAAPVHASAHPAHMARPHRPVDEVARANELSARAARRGAAPPVTAPAP